MSTLAIDLGTTAGFAILRDDGRIESGTAKFAAKKGQGEGVRFVNFRFWLVEMKHAYDVNQIAFERVAAHKGTAAAHAYGGFLATLTSFAEHHRIPYTGHPVGTIKKAWTGNGNATKNDMIAKAKARGFKPKDHNEADAIALLHLTAGRA